MNEADWLTSRDPGPMLEYLNERASGRKLRLVSCAIVRHAPFAGDGRTAWELLPECTWYGSPTLNCQTVVESAERYADGHETPETWDLARKFAWQASWLAEGDMHYEHFEEAGCGESEFFLGLAEAVGNVVSDYGKPSNQPPLWLASHFTSYVRSARRGQGLRLHSKHERRVCGLIREIVGNPFRPVALDRDWLDSDGREASRIVRSIYERRAFEELPILGSALEKAGCDAPEILAHCRLPNGHALGCWAVDALLGRA